MKINTLTIENMSGGWINDFAKTQGTSPQTKPYTYYTGLFNMNKPNYLGQMSSTFGQNPNTMSANELGVNATFASDNNAYVILRNGIIKVFPLTSSWAPAASDYTAPAGCTTDSYKDIWKHVYNSGFESIFYTYQTATTAYVASAPIASIVTPNVSGAVMPFALTYLNVPHVGVKSVNNQSYVTDKHILRAYDPNANSWSSVNCGIGNTLVSVADYGNYVAAVGGDGTTSWLFLWTGTSATVPTYKYEIRDTNVTAVVNEGGELRVFTYGKNGTTKIKTFTGSSFSEEADWEVPTSLCSSPLHNQVDVWLNQITWRSYSQVGSTLTSGYIWTYGSPRKNELQTGAHRVGQVTSTTPLLANTGGFLKNLYQDSLYMGVYSAGSYFIYNVKADTSYGSSAPSRLTTGLYRLPTNSSIERIQFFFSDYLLPTPSSSGSSLTLNLYKDYDTTTNWLGQSIPIGDTTNTKIYKYPFLQAVPEVDSFYLDIVFTFCTIKKIVVTYSYDDNDL